MARIDNSAASSRGRVGSVVYFKRDGKDYVRLHQPNIKQTDATVAAARTFGRAIIYAKHLRHGIRSILHDPKDRDIMYKMNRAVQSWLKTKPDLTVGHDRLEHLHGLDFNNVMWRIKFPIEVEWSQPGHVQVKFPAFNPQNDIAAKAGTTHIVWKIAVAGVTTEEFPRPVRNALAEFRTPYKKVELPENVITLPYKLEPATINIVALSVHLCFDEHGTRQKDKTWEPAGLVGAWYEV
jgi:hypothetical protein